MFCFKLFLTILKMVKNVNNINISKLLFFGGMIMHVTLNWLPLFLPKNHFYQKRF